MLRIELTVRLGISPKIVNIDWVNGKHIQRDEVKARKGQCDEGMVKYRKMDYTANGHMEKLPETRRCRSL